MQIILERDDDRVRKNDDDDRLFLGGQRIRQRWSWNWRWLVGIMLNDADADADETIYSYDRIPPLSGG